MRLNTLIIFALIPAFSNAQMWTNTTTGAVCEYPPPHPAHIFNTTEWYSDNHWQMFSLKQQAEWDAKIAAERSEAEAAQMQYADIQPAVFAPRMDGTNVLGQSQLMFDADNEPYGTSDTGSPKHTAEQEAKERAAHDAKKAAKKAAKAAVLSSSEPNNVKAMWQIFTNYVANQ